MKQAGFPDGCTQATHDAAYNAADYTADEWNDVMREVEWRAEEEVASGAQRFVDWLMDRNDISDLSRMIAYYKSGRMTDCRTIVDNIVTDYQQYRVATLDRAEEAEIMEGL